MDEVVSLPTRSVFISLDESGPLWVLAGVNVDMWMCSMCRFDITEVQICLAGLQMLTATVGPCLWNMRVNLPAAAAWLTAGSLLSPSVTAELQRVT